MKKNIITISIILLLSLSCSFSPISQKEFTDNTNARFLSELKEKYGELSELSLNSQTTIILSSDEINYYYKIEKSGKYILKLDIIYPTTYGSFDINYSDCATSRFNLNKKGKLSFTTPSYTYSFTNDIDYCQIGFIQIVSSYDSSFKLTLTSP